MNPTRKSAVIAGVFFIVAAVAAVIALALYGPVPSVVTLRQQFAGHTGANSSALLVVGKGLVVIHNWTFLFGPSLAIGVNTLLLAYLMYTSGLVPRIIAVLGLVGGPVIFAAGHRRAVRSFPTGLRLGGDRGTTG
jgi:hypothetical protein